ncbi:MAG TPA: hypothetical protein VIT38_08115 [Allosphingosinicella sp.]
MGRLYLDAFLIAGDDRSRFQADWYTPEDGREMVQINLRWEGPARQSAPTNEGLRATFFVGEGVVPEGRAARIEIRRPSGALLVVGDYSRALDYHSIAIATGVLRTMLEGGDMLVRVVDDRGREVARRRVSLETMSGPARMFAQVRSRWENMLAEHERACLYTGPNAL